METSQELHERIEVALAEGRRVVNHKNAHARLRGIRAQLRGIAALVDEGMARDIRRVIDVNFETWIAQCEQVARGDDG